MILAAVTDAMGNYGSLLHYSFVIAMVGSALMIFLYLWRKKRLDMDEAPKYQMMDENRQGENGHE